MFPARSKRPAKHVSVAFLVSLGLLGAVRGGVALGPRDDERRAVAEAIAARIQELDRLRSERREVAESFERDLSSVQARRAELEERVDELDAELSLERREVAERRHDRDEASAALERAQRGLASLRDSLAQVGERLHARLEHGIPHEREARLDRLGVALRQSLEWFGFAAEELRLARGVELSHEPVLLEDGTRRVHATRVRLGLVSEFWVSEDGALCGLAAPDGSGWTLQTEAAVRAALEHALFVLQRREPPALVLLPVPLGPESGLAGAPAHREP